jgi:hypothetical protein
LGARLVPAGWGSDTTGDWLLLTGHSFLWKITPEKNFPEVSEGPDKVITPNKNQSGFRKMVDNSTRLPEPAKISSLSPEEWTIFPCNPTLDFPFPVYLTL